MKRIISMLVAIATIMCLFCGCGQKYTKFESDEKLVEHLTALWRCSVDEYFLFKDNKIYEFSVSTVEGLIDDYLLEVAKKDYSKIEKVTAKESLEYVNKQLENYENTERCTIEPQKGTIRLNDYKYLLVYKDTLTFVDEYKETTDTCEKISEHQLFYHEP